MERASLPPTVAYEAGAVRIVDQRELPHRLVVLELHTCDDVSRAIRDMAIRGAPAIGCAAALGLALAAKAACALPPAESAAAVRKAADLLKAARPTAVNLFWAVDRVLGAIGDRTGPEAANAAEAEAVAMLEEDVRVNHAIGRHGLSVLSPGCAVLTHCNAGALATVGYGTALGVVRAGYEAGVVRHVYADETRPRLQGMQLTAWELSLDGIPVTVIVDGAAAWLMRQRKIDVVIVGADRVASNGDAANKIGTYALAIVARKHNVPFYVAAPTSTIDMNLPSGDDIPIEERSEAEVTHIDRIRLAPEGVHAWNPAFDVTPAELITGLITECGVVAAKPAALAQLHRERSRQHRGRA